jgi:excisionase family DNA binding protein
VAAGTGVVNDRLLSVAVPPELFEAIAERAAELVLERQPMLEPSPFMTIPEATEYIRAKSRQRVDDLLSSGRLTRHKDGSRTLVSRSELDEYLGADCPPVAGKGPRAHLERVRGVSR